LLEQVQQNGDYRVERGKILVGSDKKEHENQRKIGDSDDHIQVILGLDGGRTGDPVEVDQKESHHCLKYHHFGALGNAHL
jgi:hypothetical protein